MVMISGIALSQSALACGSAALQYTGLFESDVSGMGARAEINVYRSDLRQITLRASEHTTRIQHVWVWEANSHQWINYSSQFPINTKLKNNAEVSACVPKSYNVTDIVIDTSGSDNGGHYELYLGYSK
jgi:hypothetical protein